MGLLSTIMSFGARDRSGTSGMLPRDVQLLDLSGLSVEKNVGSALAEISAAAPDR